LYVDSEKAALEVAFFIDGECCGARKKPVAKIAAG
jgi:hypothetical protein